jgi:DNA-binding response OmpR family regulator
MGGEITLNSTLGQGSTFNFRLMLVELNKNENAPEYTQAKAISYEGEPKTVLVVDDEPHQRQMMADLLIPLGFEVLLAEHAVMGFELLTKHQIALIMMDVRMPNMDGWQMVKEVRDLGYIMPVLMVSANTRDAESHMADERFHNGYMAKPVNLTALLGKIGELINVQWQYAPTEAKLSLEPIQSSNSKKPVTNHQYKILISLAEIGYLSGFKNKSAELHIQYHFPDEVTAQINEYVELCNFPKIIGYLEELCDE